MTRPQLLLAALTMGLVAPLCYAQTVDQYELGRSLCNDGRMEEALPIYQKITKENPDYPFGWLGLGWSLHYTGKLKEALPAYRKAIELGAWTEPNILCEMARCELALGDKERSIADLRRAFDLGLTNVQRLKSDDRFASLREDKRFRKMVNDVDTSKFSRLSGWKYDLELLEKEIQRMHYRPFAFVTKAALHDRIAKIERNLHSLNDDELTTAVAAIIHDLHDGHTSIEAKFQSSENQRALPLLIGQFEEGVYITATDAAHEDLLWAKIETVNSHPIADVYSALSTIAPRDNEIRLRATVPQLMRFPNLLHGLHLAPSAERTSFELTDRIGVRRTVTLDASGAVKDWIRTPPDGKSPLPHYYEKRFDLYWFEYDADTKSIFLQYNGCGDKDEEPVAAFAKRLSTFVSTHDVEKLIVDLRFNGGGNNFVSVPLLEAIIGCKANQAGKLFVLTSRNTFSAAIVLTAQLERYTAAILVGEPTPSEPNFVGENNYLTLPYSGIRVSLSNLYWQNSHAMDHRKWIAPKIPVTWNFEEMVHGRDPGLAAALAYGK